MINGKGMGPTLDLSPAEFFSLGIRSQSRILDWRGERLLGPLESSGLGHSVYQLYRFLIERIDYPDGRVKEIRLLEDLRGIGRYLRNINLLLDDCKLVIRNGPDDPPPEDDPPGHDPPGGPGDIPGGGQNDHGPPGYLPGAPPGKGFSGPAPPG